MDKYIDAEAAVETFRLWFERIGTKPSFEDVQTIIQQVPAADVEAVRHGRWHDVYLLCDGRVQGTCSACATTERRDGNFMPDYCPNCGAHMDGEA